jgi:hypothetical protein
MIAPPGNRPNNLRTKEPTMILRPVRSFVALAAVCAIALPVAAFALREDPAQAEESESDRKQRKARRLFEAMNQREVMEQSTKAGTEAFAKMGLPDSFTESFLDRFDYDRMIDASVEIYAETLDEETIDALITFHESEQGKLYAGLLPELAVATFRVGQKYGEELALEIIQGGK